MGLGFALFLWFIFFMIVAAVCSVILGLVTARLLKKNVPRESRLFPIIAAVALPPVSVVFGLFGFMAYVSFCQGWDVDPGMGDSYGAPMGEGYYLGSIDDGDWQISSPPGSERITYSIVKIGYDPRFIYIENALGNFVLIDKKTRLVTERLSREQLNRLLRESHSPPVKLVSPVEAYDDLRWQPRDLIAIPLIFGMPFLLTVLLAVRIFTLRKNFKATAVSSPS